MEKSIADEQKPIEPQKRKRIKEGEDVGMIEGFDYPLKIDGTVDWEKLVDPKYLIYPNDDHTRDPMVRVDGMRDLAELRGIVAKEVEFQAPSDRLVICRVKILFIPNRDNPQGRVWESIADASPENLNSRLFGRFLAACAETRATGRCIKEALGIRMLVQEEVSDAGIDGDANLPVADEVLAAIDRQASLKGIEIADLVSKLKAEHPEINSLKDLTREQGAKTLQWLNAKQNVKK
jgi:hypothetical protein